MSKNYNFETIHNTLITNKQHADFDWKLILLPKEDMIEFTDGTQQKLPQYTIVAISSAMLPAIENMCTDHFHTDIYVSNDSLFDICNDLFSSEMYKYLEGARCPCCTFSKNEFECISTRLSEILCPSLSETHKRNLTRIIVIQILSNFYRQAYMLPDVIPSWLEDFVIKLQSPECFCKPIGKIIQPTNYSRARFAYLFKTYYKCTLAEYVMQLKINYAKNLLEYSQKTVLEISSMIGYDSVSSFIHIFKSKTGQTPSEYRRLHLRSHAQMDSDE